MDVELMLPLLLGKDTRQALAALQDVVPYKRELWPLIRQWAEAIDVTRYKDTMWGLLEKDVRELLNGMKEGSCSAAPLSLFSLYSRPTHRFLSIQRVQLRLPLVKNRPFGAARRLAPTCLFLSCGFLLSPRQTLR